MQVQRQDFGAIKRATPTPQGGLKLDAWPTRIGVLTYQNQDGSVTRELRHPDEVFAPASLATMQHAPLTDLHPLGRVDAQNYVALSRGHVTSDVAVADDKVHVAATVLVQDADMLRMIDRGERKELSCGYACELDATPGEYEGERYDSVQRGIVYNHVALLPSGAGRAGPTAALRLDGLCVVATDRKDSKDMKTVRIDGKDYEVGSDLHLSKLDEQRDLAVKVEKDRADGLASELKTTKEKLDAAELAAKPEAIAARVAERVSLERFASKVLGSKYSADGKDDVAVMRDVGTKIAPKSVDKLDAKKGRDAVNAYFDGLRAAYDAMPSIGEDEPEEEEDPEVAAADSDEEDEEDAVPAPKAKDSKQDSFAARKRAEGRTDSARVQRVDNAASHQNMVARIRGMSAVKHG